MARHRTAQEKVELAQRAKELRLAGRSRREIQEQLGIGDDLAKAFLRDVPLPDRLLRPRAKDDVRAVAEQMRRAGSTYDEIVADLGVSKSTCSLWLRDVVVDGVAAAPPAEPAEGPQQEARELRLAGLPLRAIADRLGTSAKTVYYWTWDLPVPAASRHGGDAAHMDMMRQRYWDRVQAERAEERARIQQANAARVGAITRRELELAAVVAYWCEGSTSKPWKRKETVAFINSDPGLILLWCAWLDDIGFPVEHQRLSLSIHTSADVPAATAHWADLIGVQVTAFGPPSLKRHNPKTVRKNVGDGYVGCLVVRLVQCREVYQRIEGVWQGIMGGLPAGSLDGQSRVV